MRSQLDLIFSSLDTVKHFLVDISHRYEILENVQGFRGSGLKSPKQHVSKGSCLHLVKNLFYPTGYDGNARF